MENFNQYLKKYAELIVSIGVNVREGQTVVLAISVEQVALARLIVKAAYNKGAKDVIVKWQDDAINRLFLENSQSLEIVPLSQKMELDEHLEAEASRISVISSNPKALFGVDTDRIKKRQFVMGEAMQKMRRATQNNDISWTVVAAASPEWAKLVFPEVSEKEAVNQLWEAIFKSVRLDKENPIKAWQEHDSFLAKKAYELNQYQFSALHYQAPETDLIIGLPKNHLWEGAGAINKNGAAFMPNMPTEEVFTAPDRNRVDGYVTSTKPLSYAGIVFEKLKFTFKNGKIVDYFASNDEEVLKNLLETDEGSKFLGEVALVPDPSPISQSGITFFNTLFDENASNHLAIGSAYSFSIKNGTSMSDEKLLESGLNRSQVHVDFMIGSKEMSIDGIQPDGTRIPVFKSGDWA